MVAVILIVIGSRCPCLCSAISLPTSAGVSPSGTVQACPSASRKLLAAVSIPISFELVMDAGLSESTRSSPEVVTKANRQADSSLTGHRTGMLADIEVP